MTSLTLHKIENPNTKEVEYFFYTMPDFSGFTNYTAQAKPLLVELKSSLESMQDQAEGSHQKQLETIKTYEAKIKAIEADNQANLIQLKEKYEAALKQTNEKWEKELEEAATKIDACRDQLQECLAAKQEAEKKLEEADTNIDLYKNQLEETTQKLNSSNEQFSKFKKAAEKEVGLAADETKLAQEAALKSIESLKLANKEIFELNAQVKHFKSLKLKENINLSAIDRINAAYEEAMSISSKRAYSNTSSTIEALDSSKQKNNYQTDMVLNENPRKENNKLKIKMSTTLPEFHGKPDSNIEEWLYAATRILDMANYTDREKVAVASNYLRDIALADYLLHEQMVGKESWDSFKEYMRKKYTPANHNQIIRQKIKNLIQITTVKDYYVEFRKLAIQAHGMNEEERMSWFIGNMKPELAKFVYLKECKTIEEAYDQANLCETYANEKNNSTNIFFSAEIPSNNLTSNYGPSSPSNNLQNKSKNQQYQPRTQTRQVSFNNQHRQQTHHQQQLQQRHQYQQEQQHPDENSDQHSSTEYLDQQQEDSTINEFINETCCICNKKGHIGENCQTTLTCATCNLNGHTTSQCRQHLYCTNCHKHGHLAK